LDFLGSKAKATSIDISGSGLSTDVTHVNVTIGGVECKVTTAQIDNISCDVGDGPLGTYPIIVDINGKGRASGDVHFTYISELTAISPSSGSVGGKACNGTI
jgi:hypothetical protein